MGIVSDNPVHSQQLVDGYQSVDHYRRVAENDRHSVNGRDPSENPPGIRGLHQTHKCICTLVHQEEGPVSNLIERAQALARFIEEMR